MTKSNIKVALCFNDVEHVGGGYQQQLSTIIEICRNLKHDFYVLVFDEPNIGKIRELGIKYIYIKEGMIRRVIRLLMFKFVPIKLIKIIKYTSVLEKEIIKNGIRLAYFLSPTGYESYLLKTPYITTVWDLCHRDHPEFPEVSHYKAFESREKLYRKILPKASAVITDSFIGKNNVVRRYGVDEEKVYPVYFKPSTNIINHHFSNIAEKYSIDDNYIFYPSNIWPHKNHIYIIDALKELKKNNYKLDLVLTGKDEGNFHHVLTYAKSAGVSEQVKFLGFVPGSDLYTLYKQSIALVMPSFFGPTNIPPLEAFYVGVPVICSGLPGFHEYLGDAALYCDLNNPKSLVYQLQYLLKDINNRDYYIAKGKIQLDILSNSTPLAETIDSIIKGIMIKLKCWPLIR